MKSNRLVLTLAALLGAVLLLSGKGLPLIKSVLGGGAALIGVGGASLASSPEGKSLPSPGIALANGATANVRDVSSFFEPTVETETPASAVNLAEMPGCDFRSPRAGEVIGNVLVGRGGLPTPVSALSRSHLAAAALAEVRARRGGAAPERAIDPAPMGAVDVFVTERNAPVYLILQSDDGDVLWNVQPAPGARIAHIAIVAAGQAGLLVPDAGISVETLRVSEHPGCAVAPARKPDDTARGAGNGTDALAAFEAYDAWFQTRFGIAADANLVGFHETSHALVGPVPAIYDKVMQNRLAGARIAVSDADLVAIGPGDARTGRANAAVLRLANQAAGGDLAALGFTPLNRTE